MIKIKKIIIAKIHFFILYLSIILTFFSMWYNNLMLLKLFWQKHYKKIVPFLALGLIVLLGHFVFSKNNDQTATEKENKSKSGVQTTADAEKLSNEDEQLKAKIGQMLIVGFRGTKFQENSFVDKALQDLKIGGVVLFDFDVPSGMFPRNIVNPKQTKQLISGLQKHSVMPLFVAVDVEGGFVNRLKPKYGFLDIPSAQRMGQGTLEQTKQIAKILGKELQELGINFNFAPVVDSNINPKNPAIGALERSFSADPEKVIAHAESFIKGLSEYNIITSLKHFPGHGSSQTDSHNGITDITNTFQAQELFPFQELIKKGMAPTVMVGHLINKNVDQNFPATLSVNFIQKTLKEMLGFKGVVVCDDLSMGAISQNYGAKEAAAKMVGAGCDLLIISNNVKTYDETIPYQARDAIFEAVKSGKISTSSIKSSYEKILKLKKDFEIIH